MGSKKIRWCDCCQRKLTDNDDLDEFLWGTRKDFDSERI